MADTTDHVEALRERLAQLRREIAEREDEAGRVERALSVLTNREQDVKAKHMMQQSARVHQSQARSDDPDDLVVVANEAHHSLRSLATKVGCSASLLSQARRKDYETTISLVLAKKIEFETKSPAYPKGFEATRKNWPRLRSE